MIKKFKIIWGVRESPERFRFHTALFSQHRQALMGIAAIGIVVMHAVSIGLLTFPFVRGLEQVLVLLGSTGVDTFCFMSGMGIFFSLSKKPSLCAYFRRRLIRIGLPFLLIAVPGYFLIGVGSAGDYLLKISTLWFWVHGNDGMWFVPFILCMYLLSPAFFTLLCRRGEKGRTAFFVAIIAALAALPILDWTTSALMGRIGIALEKVPIFMIGMLLGDLTRRKKTIPWWIAALLLALSVLEYTVPVFGMGAVSSLIKSGRSFCFLCAVCLILDRVRMPKMEGALNWVGAQTLEIYLVHMFFINAIKQREVEVLRAPYAAFFLLCAATLLISSFVRFISRRIEAALL